MEKYYVVRLGRQSHPNLTTFLLFPPFPGEGGLGGMGGQNEEFLIPRLSSDYPCLQITDSPVKSCNFLLRKLQLLIKKYIIS
ncbi:MAG: hypothetical protein FOGNACKC_03425 [Anaerolineae bacterium]|nr:hypothetical protein [Anaerolineae bacterium]